MTPIPLSNFADQLSEIIPVMMKEFLRRQVQEICQCNLTFPQFVAMEFIVKKQDPKMTDLANYMAVTTAAMTGIIERLVRDKYVERLYDPSDRRIIKVKLTSNGAALVKKMQIVRRKMILNVFSQISPKDREAYLRILSKVRDILVEEHEAN